MSFEILPHTADIRIRVTGATLEELFLNAARGMTSIIKSDYEQLVPEPKRRRLFTVQSLDRETLLIEFLSELLRSIDTENELYPDLRITELHEKRLTAEATGAPVEKFDEDIKAVTYHDVTIAKHRDGSYETTITLDI